MINFYEIIAENTQGYNQHWLQIPDHPCRIPIIEGSGTGQRITVSHLINTQRDIDKIYLYSKDLYESKYQLLIKERQEVGQEHFKDPKAFTEYVKDMKDVYKSFKGYNLRKKRKMLGVFDVMIFDIISNKNFHLIVTNLFRVGN